LHSCKQQARSYTNVAQAALLHASAMQVFT